MINDRHDLSSQAYQGGGRRINDEKIKFLKKFFLNDCKPDLTFYLDVSPEIGLKRVYQRGELDRIEENESLNFFIRTRQKYLDIVNQKQSMLLIDATQPFKKVVFSVKKELKKWMIKMKI